MAIAITQAQSNALSRLSCSSQALLRRSNSSVLQQESRALGMVARMGKDMQSLGGIIRDDISVLRARLTELEKAFYNLRTFNSADGNVLSEKVNSLSERIQNTPFSPRKCGTMQDYPYYNHSPAYQDGRSVAAIERNLHVFFNRHAAHSKANFQETKSSVDNHADAILEIQGFLKELTTVISGIISKLDSLEGRSSINPEVAQSSTFSQERSGALEEKFERQEKKIKDLEKITLDQSKTLEKQDQLIKKLLNKLDISG